MKKNPNLKIKVNGKQSGYPKQKKYQKLSTSSFEKTKKDKKRMNYPSIKKQSTKPPRNKKQFSTGKKRIAFASLSAIIIGSLMGLIMLNMFGTLHEEQEYETNQVSKTNTSKNAPVEGSSTDKQKHILPTITAFVLQGGVFSEQANLDEMTALFKQVGQETLTWKRDQVTYLFVGLAHDEKIANTLASKMNDKSLETYVKEWSTPETEVSLSSIDYKWLTNFQQLWNQALPSVQNKTIDGKQWKELYGNQVESEEMKSFIKQTSPIIEKLISKPGDITDMHFLKLWLEYEKLLHSFKS